MDFDYQRLTDKIYLYLKDKIIQNHYQPGEKLQEQDIADTLDVSRTPVREAINKLGADGLVDIVPRRGAFVTKPSIRDIKDIYELREALEVLAIELLIPQIADADVKYLEKIQNDFQESLGQNDVENCFAIDRHFHDYLITKSDNKKLEEMYQQIGSVIHLTRSLHCDDKKLQEMTFSEHEKMISAIKSRDLDLSIKYAREHLQRVKNDLMEKYKNSTNND